MKGLNAIKDYIDNGTFKKNVKILGVKVPEPKKLLVNYYNQIINKEGGKYQLEAAYRHCCNIVMNQKGMTDKEINDYWWRKLNDKNKKL